MASSQSGESQWRDPDLETEPLASVSPPYGSTRQGVVILQLEVRSLSLDLRAVLHQALNSVSEIVRLDHRQTPRDR